VHIVSFQAADFRDMTGRCILPASHLLLLRLRLLLIVF
jgi:hypothetical protein